ncbi:hypothetical protein [Fictibacillus sp. S7]|uniref:hypothetical protein n=1 Tax=Fictibacillus sp. S7 TaxID=2212476 RepID=UPI001013A6FD|nr:hypothetical protein [Fictibacillus sp. S7]RXY98549.1 hypothetical protein DMO16_02075 [Fictibacillus sp. S7]
MELKDRASNVSDTLHFMVIRDILIENGFTTTENFYQRIRDKMEQLSSIPEDIKKEILEDLKGR